MSTRRQPKPKRSAWISAAAKFLEIGKPLGMMFCAGIAGVAAYLFTPLQAKVNQKLFPSHATVEVFSQQQEIFEEDSYVVDVFVSSTKWNPVPSGKLEIEYPSKILEPEHGSKVKFNTRVVDGTIRVTPETGVRFYAHRAGSGQIKATLTIPSTKAQFSGSRIFQVKPSEQRQFPTLRNYSGNWTLELGNRTADVKLKETGRIISGTYMFQGSRRPGFITGQRDSTYSLALIDPAKPFVRYRLEGKSPTSDEQGIELKGVGKYQEFTKMSREDLEAARPTNEEDIQFHMVAASR